jgi:L-seryl-tRNA(Ser) seleniumtransferase
LATLEERAQQLASLIREADPHHHLQVQVQPSSSQIGGGALPNQDLPTYAVAVSSPGISTQSLEARMRANRPPIIGRIEADHYLMDVRTLQPEQFLVIQEALQRILQ